MTPDDRVDPGSGEDPRVEALVHLRRAALEFIAAARAMLDLAEDAVRFPGGLAAVVAETVGTFAAAAEEWRTPRGRAGGDATDGDPPPDEGRAGEPERVDGPGRGAARPRPTRVQHIRIS